MIERTFYILGSKSDGTVVEVELKNATNRITESWLRNRFLPVAEPVLGIVAVESAYYVVNETDYVVGG